METTNLQICSAIKFRRDERKIYWRVRTADGGTPYVSFYWGGLPTEQLQKLLEWINAPTINNRKKICRMVALSKLPKEKLLDSEFLKSAIFKRLKDINKPSQLILAACRRARPKIKKKMVKLKLKVKQVGQDKIKGANDLRHIGVVLETLTGHSRLLKRDYIKFKHFIPEYMPLSLCQLAMSVWRQYPDEIVALSQANAIMKRAMEAEQ